MTQNNNNKKLMQNIVRLALIFNFPTDAKATIVLAKMVRAKCFFIVSAG